MEAEAASQARPERTDAVSGKLAVGCSVRQEALWKLGLLHFIG